MAALGVLDTGPLTGTEKIVSAVANITGTGTITVAGLTTIDNVFAFTPGAATIPMNVATVVSWTGNVVTVSVVNLQAAANVISAVAVAVTLVAFGH